MNAKRIGYYIHKLNFEYENNALYFTNLSLFLVDTHTGNLFDNSLINSGKANFILESFCI